MEKGFCEPDGMFGNPIGAEVGVTVTFGVIVLFLLGSV